jgi:hypothetical protein
VQTLAYGAAQVPNIPAPPASAQAAPRPMASAVPRQAVAAPTTPQPAEVAPAPRPVAPTMVAGNGATAEFAQKLGGLGLTPAQIEGVLSLSREVVEKVVWEVVPTLAETIIKEEIKRLTTE